MSESISNARPNLRQDEGGFTLVELSIVILILGILITIAGLNYSNISRGINMNGARKQVEAALNRAKTAARQENVTYQLVFYTDSHAGNPNSYEFLHNELTGYDALGDPIWSMTPIDGSVSGEEVTSAGGHYYISIAGGVKITGCTEISGDTIKVHFSPAGTTMSISGTDGEGGNSSGIVTLNLSSGDKTGSVSINDTGDVTVE